MKLFRLTRKPGSGEEDKELVLDTDAEPQASPQDTTEVEVSADAPTDTPTPDGAVEAITVVQQPSPPPEAEGRSPQEDDSPDPGPVDTLDDAKNGAHASTSASELENIPINDLLTDLLGVSRRLGVAPRPHSEPACDEAPDVVVEVHQEEEATEAAEPDGSGAIQEARRSPTGHGRYALPVLMLCLALIGAIGGFLGMERLADAVRAQLSPAQSQDSHSKPPVVVATVPGGVVGQDGQPGIAPDPSPEATPEPTPEGAPEPTPEFQPAYFLYTVQPGDTVLTIAEAFAVSPDYILWNNPDAIYDPNLVLAADELLIPSVDGIIYRVQRGDSLSAIASLYQIDVESILAFAPNGLTSPESTIEGMVLILPGAVPSSNDRIWP